MQCKLTITADKTKLRSFVQLIINLNAAIEFEMIARHNRIQATRQLSYVTDYSCFELSTNFLVPSNVLSEFVLIKDYRCPFDHFILHF